MRDTWVTGSGGVREYAQRRVRFGTVAAPAGQTGDVHHRVRGFRENFVEQHLGIAPAVSWIQSSHMNNDRKAARIRRAKQDAQLGHMLRVLQVNPRGRKMQLQSDD